MNILITGGAGFIGSNLADKLIENSNNKVIAIDNFDDYYLAMKDESGNIKKEDEGKIMLEDIDGNPNTKSHTHIHSYESLATKWGYYNDGKPNAKKARELFEKKAKEYPNKKPEVCFLTPIYHINVNPKAGMSEPLGHVCISTLNWWTPQCTIRQVLTDIFALFWLSNPESPYGLERAEEMNRRTKLLEVVPDTD